ncbi:MAG: hypothetical protein WBO35_02035 [Candidatus Saccharimonadales bacterium]
MKKLPTNLWVKFFDGLGYLLVLGEWLVLGLLYVPDLLESEWARSFFPASNQVKPTPVETTNAVESTWFMQLAATFLGLLFLLLIGYIIFRKYVPAVVRTGEKAIEKTAQEAVRVREKRKPHLTKKKRALLTSRTRFWLEVVAAVLPLALFMTLVRDEDTLLTTLAQLCLACLSLLALCCFGLSRLITKDRLS